MLLQISKQYELDYRDRGRGGLKIQSSVKNFQLTLEVIRTSLTQRSHWHRLKASKFNTLIL